MVKAIFATALLLIVTVSVRADDKSSVLSVVHQLVDGFNSGDTKSFLAACAKETSIIDEIPPHEWHGAGGCAQWMNDYGVFVERNKIANAVTTMSAPRRIQISGDNAYLVMPAKCDYTENGKAIHEDVIVTLTLRRAQSGWHMTGWVWARL